MVREGVSVSNVVSLAEHRPHITGEARCLSCKHAWQAVAPIGTSWMDCPKCEHHTATWYAKTMKDGEHLECNCGCIVFHISDIYQIYCAFCGLHQGSRVAP